MKRLEHCMPRFEVPSHCHCFPLTCYYANKMVYNGGSIVISRYYYTLVCSACTYAVYPLISLFDALRHLKPLFLQTWWRSLFGQMLSIGDR